MDPLKEAAIKREDTIGAICECCGGLLLNDTCKACDDAEVEGHKFAKRTGLVIPALCDSCGTNLADSPSKLCPGCQAYREHQT